VVYLFKVWPYEENDEHGFAKELFSKMVSLFKVDQSSSNYMQLSDSPEVFFLLVTLFLLPFLFQVYLPDYLTAVLYNVGF
jgi:hypothetical protein